MESSCCLNAARTMTPEDEEGDADAADGKSQQAHGGRTVTRHPNFRLFLTMDPAFGEISRPMRNRLH